ncbi:PepSY-associated TM helix family protein [Alcanivorax balearicus MACL04]|uniref:PepSY-associated TM helix family protein n=1 Tax=Alloalcanivorax balearicus MACL04 TaxID=1177182 RepID=A0ABT2QZ10_9GAMM|nr:PepSY domain-containing protein [Alloalcanivorax balearicus]MCU5782757.1 PepSY-associated TM helix family protein [Alloalcanivorax balearicus MACL04]
MTSRAFRIWSFVHKWTSLVATVFMLMLCLTGLPLIFHHEIEHLTLPELETLPEDHTTVAVQSIIDQADHNRPDEQVLYAFFDDEDPLVIVATGASPMSAPETFHYQTFDLRNGRQLQVAQPTEGFMYVMRRLHVDLFAALPGMLFLGLMGLLVMVAIVSGVVLYAPFMRKQPFATVRTQRSRRLRWLDLHNLLGIVTVVWLTVVTLTGMINTLAVPIERLWQASELAAMSASHRDRPVPEHYAAADRVTGEVRAAFPDSHLLTLAFPGTPFASPHHYGVYLVGNTPVTSRVLTPVLADAASGEITATRAMPWYAQTLFLSQPLHFGDYGGLPLKLLWTVLDLITIVVLVSGLYLWLGKRRGSKRATEEEPDYLLEDTA